MKTILPLFFMLILFIESCGQLNSPDSIAGKGLDSELINLEGKTILERFTPPEDFIRVDADSESFASWIRLLPLKEHGADVKLYDGTIKENNEVYVAVVDLPIGKKNLHQCADAVMRLRAEYLWKSKKYDQIHFNFTNGFRVDYSEWMKGKRIKVDGNKTSWVQSGSPSNTYNDFWNYMEVIFNYAGTLSLSNEMKSVAVSEMQIGDVFIQGGSPGHAVIVVDMAINKKTNENIFMLAQSYMPAQELQILMNPMSIRLNPWYSVDFEGDLTTPEWTFTKHDLKRFAKD